MTVDPSETPVRFELFPALLLLELFTAPLPWLAVRLYFAQRAFGGAAHRSAMRPAALERALGRRLSARAIQDAERALERAGLMRRDLFGGLSFPKPDRILRARFAAALPARALGRPVPVPHWVCRTVARSSRRTRAAVLIAHVVRLAWRERDGTLCGWGRCAAAWAERWFGVAARQVHDVRADLVASGQLVPDESVPAWTVRRFGPAFRLRFEGAAPAHWQLAGGLRAGAGRIRTAGVPRPPRITTAAARGNEHSFPNSCTPNEHRAAGSPEPSPMRPAAGAALRIPRVSREGLADPAVLEQIHVAAAPSGCVARGEAGLLEVATLAERARRLATHNAGGLLYRLLQAPPADRSHSAADESRARARLGSRYRYLYLEPPPGPPDPERPERAERAAAGERILSPAEVAQGLEALAARFQRR